MCSYQALITDHPFFQLSILDHKDNIMNFLLHLNDTKCIDFPQLAIKKIIHAVQYYEDMVKEFNICLDGPITVKFSQYVVYHAPSLFCLFSSIHVNSFLPL